MAAANTYVAISPAYTLGSAQASVTFSSISGAYTDLVLVANVKGVGTGYSQIQINGSAVNLSRLWLRGDGSSAVSSKASDNYIVGGTTVNSTDFAFNSITHIFNYANTTTYKTLLTRANNAALGAEAVVNTWRSASAITSISYNISSYNMDIGSTFSLYGILAA